MNNTELGTIFLETIHLVEDRLLLLLRVDKMLLEVLSHPEALDLLLSEDGSHGFIRGEPLLVLGVLEVVLLQVGPEFLDTLQKRVSV